MSCNGVPFSAVSTVLITSYLLCLSLADVSCCDRRKAANVYFLVIGLLYSWETVSPVAGLTRLGTLGALFIIIVFALAVDASADYARYKKDVIANNTSCWTLVRPSSTRPSHSST